MRARDIMTSPVHTVWQNASVESAAELMTAESVTALPVVDADGTLVGMVSESDLLWHRVPPDPTAYVWRRLDTDPEDRPGMVLEVMAADPLTTRPETDLAEIADQMLRSDVRSMPVVEDGVIVGIISRRDILRAVVRGDYVLAKEVQHRLDEYSDGAHRWSVTVDGGIATVVGQCLNDTELAVVTVLARTVPGIAGVKVESAKE